MKDPRWIDLCLVARLSSVQNAKILCEDTGQKKLLHHHGSSLKARTLCFQKIPHHMLQPAPRKAPNSEPVVWNSQQFGYKESWNVLEMLELSSAS